MKRGSGLKKSSNLHSDYRLKNTAIRKKGKASSEYEDWRIKEALPYLENNFPHECAKGCGEKVLLDIGHIKSRSTHPELIMDLKNIQYECIYSNRFGACLR